MNWEKQFYMNQRDLMYVKMIVEEGGISQAARKLFVSQPSLSQSVKRIEEALSVALFKRTPKGLVLTAEGEEYYRMACHVLHLYESFEDEIHNIHELKSGKVIVGTTPHRGLILFPEFLGQFYLKYPGITVSMLEAPTDELEEMLLNGKVDLAVLREPARPTERSCNFVYHGLMKETFVLLLPKGHPAGKYAQPNEDGQWPILDPKWLADETFLLPHVTLRLYENMISILNDAGIPNPKCVYRAVYMETLVDLTAAGVGVSIVTPRYAKRSKAVDQVDIYKIPESYGTFWEVSLATLKDSYLSRAASRFVEEYKDYVSRN